MTGGERSFRAPGPRPCLHVQTINRGRCRSILKCSRMQGHDGAHCHVVTTRCILHGPACPNYPTYPSLKTEDHVSENSHERAVVAHYTVGEIETIDFIDDRFDGVEFCLANIVKYATRAKHKGQLRSDLEKIRNYAVIATELLDKREKKE